MLPHEVEEDIKRLVKDVAGMTKGRMDKFIHYSVFPNFKNIAPGQRINFKYPLSVFTGSNGSGKSSVLQALYGMPKGYTTGRFWFATDLDAIDEGGAHGQNRYFYGHWFENKVVETRKARVTNHKRGPEYWEPTKPVLADGMSKVEKATESSAGRSKSRWNPVEREVLLLNFKAELSAYDKYMYFGRSPELLTIKSKQDRIRYDSRYLKVFVDTDVKKYQYYKSNILGENRLLSDVELRTVGEILGRSYESARLIKHGLFGGKTDDDGLSVIFQKKNGLTYSEAHAGSGEVAIVSAVVQILGLPENSLVLLDEPEVSLHPAAQRRLLKFLLRQIKEKKHQVVMSTHSPELIRGLPKSAVKVMDETMEGRFQIQENISPLAAFNVIGAPFSERLTIYVEDELAKEILEYTIKRKFSAEARNIDVKVPAGGAQSILGNQIPFLMEQASKVLVLLDGDQRPENFPPKSDEIPLSENRHLLSKIKSFAKCEPRFIAQGRGLLAQNNAYVLHRRYIDWYLERVRFLPHSCPEEIVLRAIRKAKDLPMLQVRDSQDAKAKLKEEIELPDSPFESAEEIHFIAKRKYIESSGQCEALTSIVELLTPFVESLSDELC